MQRVTMDVLIAAHGIDVVDRDGHRIGSIEEIYYEDGSGEARWIGIGTGIFGLSRRVVPVEGARLDDECLRVPHAKDSVKEAPAVDDDDISPEREADLYAYYGLITSTGHATDARTAAPGAGRIGSDLESNPLDEAMGDVGGASDAARGRRRAAADPDSDASVGAAASDVGMRAPELDFDKAADRQTGDDLMRDRDEGERSEGIGARLRRWTKELTSTSDDGEVETNPVTGQPRR